MRRILLLAATLTALAAAGGCATVTKTPEEVGAMYKHILDIDSRQMADDWNYLWLADRQYRMTRWHMR
jgi:hypothetical protein